MASIWNFIEVTTPGAAIQPLRALRLGLARKLDYDELLKNR
jgi:hypothetical protein